MQPLKEKCVKFDNCVRASNYNVYTRIDQTRYLITNTVSGALDCVRAGVVEFLKQHKLAFQPLIGGFVEDPVSGASPQISHRDLQTLAARGYLTELTPEEEGGTFRQIANAIHQKQQRPKFVIMPTYDCNCRCSYCFQDYMRTGTTKLPIVNHSLSETMSDKIVAACLDIEKRYGFHFENPAYTRLVCLFGGEPLLKRNKDSIRHLLDVFSRYGKNTFVAITNATELEWFRDELAPHRISRIQVTFDGSREIHDKVRITSDGSGTYDVICSNIELALNRGVQTSIRVNVDKNNIGSLPQLCSAFTSYGWADHPLFSMYAAPVGYKSTRVTESNLLNTKELCESLDGMRIKYPVLKMMRKPDDGMKDDVLAVITGRRQIYQSYKAAFCGAHNGMYVFDVVGNIFTCWERTGDSRFRVGFIDPCKGLVLEEMQLEGWTHRQVGAHPVCGKCPFGLVCGGGCAVFAEAKTGDKQNNFCNGFAQRFKKAMREAFQEWESKGFTSTASSPDEFCGV